jgi:superfamily II DNA helicase RecQ
MSSLYGSTKTSFLHLKKHIVHLGYCFLIDASNLLYHHEWGCLICNEIDNLYCSKTLKAFREGDIQVLVSSDAMTRGMDVEGVRNVINYDMPAYIKTYIHRAGRTARAGQTGRCFTLLNEDGVCCSLDCLTD